MKPALHLTAAQIKTTVLYAQRSEGCHYAECPACVLHRSAICAQATFFQGSINERVRQACKHYINQYPEIFTPEIITELCL